MNKTKRPEKDHRPTCELLTASDSSLLCGMECSCPPKKKAARKEENRETD